MITAADLGARVGLANPTAAELLEMSRVLAAVRSKIGANHILPLAATADQVAAWDEANLLAAARLWKRKDSPEGVISFTDLGVIRVGRFDADVEDLLSQFVVYVVG